MQYIKMRASCVLLASCLTVVQIVQRTHAQNPTNGVSIQLVGGLTAGEGRVELLQDGEWGTVCDHGWDRTDAHVACRSLGFDEASSETSSAEFGQGSGVILMSDVRCAGNESSLLECPSTDTEVHNCTHSEDAGVRCRDCRDLDPRCEYWASGGACGSKPGLIQTNCQRSCKQCNIDDINLVSVPENETCIVGHCYTRNSESICIPAVQICTSLTWYNGLTCAPTPISTDGNSTVRCMTFHERGTSELTNNQIFWRLAKVFLEFEELAGVKFSGDASVILGGIKANVDNIIGLAVPQKVILARQSYVKTLSLWNAGIDEVEPGTFIGLPQLLTLILGGNTFTRINNGSFLGLESLTYINLKRGVISYIESGSFAPAKSLQSLELEENILTFIEPGVFTGLRKLSYLSIGHNELYTIHEDLFEGLDSLRYLFLEDNKIRDISVGAFDGLGHLQVLNLSSNHLSHLTSRLFDGLDQLEYLDLSYNTINLIGDGVFSDLTSLRFLFFVSTEVELGELTPDTLHGLSNVEKLSTSDNRLCCLLAENDNFTCAQTSQQSPLDTCGSIYPSIALKIAGCVLGICAVLGNIVVLFIRLRIGSRAGVVQNEFIICLALADCLMGVYMLMLTTADFYYGGEFFLSAPQWRTSTMCRISGFMGFLASEASVLTLTLITIDRFLRVMFPFDNYKINRKNSIVLSVVMWIIVILLSLAPLLVNLYRPDIYGLTDVCVGLPLHVESSGTGSLEIRGQIYLDYTVEFVAGDDVKQTAWWFSILIFIGLNFVSFTFILVSYVMMFIKVSRSAASVRTSTSQKLEARTARRMAVIIVTDFVCWMPVIVMGILSQTGLVDLPTTLYAWTVILIIPVNSSINPFLYTLNVYQDLKKRQTRTPGGTNSSDSRTYISLASRFTRKQPLDN